MPFERSFETGRISVMKGYRRVLVKVVLFQFRGHGHPWDDATPNFFPNFKHSIKGLSNEVLTFSLLQLAEKKIRHQPKSLVHTVRLLNYSSVAVRSVASC